MIATAVHAEIALRDHHDCRSSSRCPAIATAVHATAVHALARAHEGNEPALRALAEAVRSP
jgi:hypothetical protein